MKKSRIFKKLACLLLAGSMAAGLSPSVLAGEREDFTNVAGINVFAASTYLEKKADRVLLSANSKVAGIALNLSRYQEGIKEGRIDSETQLSVKKLVNENTAVLDDYENLGIADVEGYNYLNVRKKPDKDGEVCGKMTTYAACEVLGKEGDWLKIRSGAVTGYAYAEYIITGEEAENIALDEACLMAVVTTKSNLNVRKKASADSKVITKITKDERYEVSSVNKGWVKISLAGLTGEDGDDLDSYGYICADYCDVRYALKAAVPYTPLDEKGTSSYTSTRAALCNYACRFIGNPYVWGGTSLTRGADCSGFVMSVFANFGYYLPRSSASQAYAGSRISSAQMKPGDLVFYGSYGINHVAIYIGGGMIVHAANTRRGIVINSWNYMTPVRIVNVLGN